MEATVQNSVDSNVQDTTEKKVRPAEYELRSRGGYKIVTFDNWKDALREFGKLYEPCCLVQVFRCDAREIRIVHRRMDCNGNVYVR
jgi:hypothetical protein